MWPEIKIYGYVNSLLIVLYTEQSIFHTFKLPFLLYTNSNDLKSATKYEELCSVNLDVDFNGEFPPCNKCQMES